MNCYNGIDILEAVEFENFDQKVIMSNVSQNCY
jgi:hypothetical protein